MNSLPNPIAGPAPRWTRLGQLALPVLCAVLAGCSTVDSGHATASAETPNVYRSAPALPAQIRRVAVLPLAADDRYSELAEGCVALDAVLNTELIKTKKFEVVRVSPDALRECVGSADWTGEEALPPEIFSSLHDAYGCDAILFCRLTEFRAYAPLAIGWRLKLVDARTRQILWAGDELFDARDQPAPDNSTRYWVLPRRWFDQSPEAWQMQNSPRRFGQYTVARLLTTLPER